MSNDLKAQGTKVVGNEVMNKEVLEQAKVEVQQDRSTTSWREEPNVEAGMTWMPFTAHGPHSDDELAMLPTTVFAYPKHRQLALTDAEHVEWAAEQFWQIKDATDSDREQAFLNLQEAAGFYHVALPVDDWRMLPRISREIRQQDQGQ
jgi:hypothetical protein